MEDGDTDMQEGTGEKKEGESWEELARRVKDNKKMRVDEVIREAVNQEEDDNRGATCTSTSRLARS